MRSDTKSEVGSPAALARTHSGWATYKNRAIFAAKPAGTVASRVLPPAPIVAVAFTHDSSIVRLFFRHEGLAAILRLLNCRYCVSTEQQRSPVPV